MVFHLACFLVNCLYSFFYSLGPGCFQNSIDLLASPLRPLLNLLLQFVSWTLRVGDLAMTHNLVIFTEMSALCTTAKQVLRCFNGFCSWKCCWENNNCCVNRKTVFSFEQPVFCQLLGMVNMIMFRRLSMVVRIGFYGQVRHVRLRPRLKPYSHSYQQSAAFYRPYLNITLEQVLVIAETYNVQSRRHHKTQALIGSVWLFWLTVTNYFH